MIVDQLFALVENLNPAIVNPFVASNSFRVFDQMILHLPFLGPFYLRKLLLSEHLEVFLYFYIKLGEDIETRDAA